MRQCNCSGNCGSSNDNLNRREFLGLVGAGGVGGGAGGGAGSATGVGGGGAVVCAGLPPPHAATSRINESVERMCPTA